MCAYTHTWMEAIHQLNTSVSFWSHRISDDLVGTADRSGYIQNFESSIDFTIDDELLIILEELGVDVNPREEELQFVLNCEVEQGDDMMVQRVPVLMKVSFS